MPLWSVLARASRLCSVYWVFQINSHGVYQLNQRGGKADQLFGTPALCSLQQNLANKLFMMAADAPAFALCQNLSYGLSLWAIPPSCKFQCRQKLFKVEKLYAGASRPGTSQCFQKGEWQNNSNMQCNNADVGIAFFSSLWPSPILFCFSA